MDNPARCVFGGESYEVFLRSIEQDGEVITVEKDVFWSGSLFCKYVIVPPVRSSSRSNEDSSKKHRALLRSRNES